MKAFSAICAALSIAVGTAAWKYSAPLLSRNGTTVIYAMTDDGKNGNKPFTVKVSADLSNRQHELLNFAYEVAKLDRIKNPQYLQGILMQESRVCDSKSYRVAGLSNRPGDRYFGCGQIKLAAAKEVMERYPEMWRYLETQTEEELQARLILDDRFNIRVASKYALIMGINENPDKAITRYNLGPGGAVKVNPADHRYTIDVKIKAKNVLSRQNGLQSSKPVQLALNDQPRRP